MPQTATLPANIQEKVHVLANALEQASRAARELSQYIAKVEGKRRDNFWAEAEELQEAFSDLTEPQITQLVDQAIHDVRSHNPATLQP